MSMELLEECVALSDGALLAELDAIELDHRRLEARRATLLATIEARGVFRVDGHRSMNAFLRARHDSGDGAISQQRKLARLIAAHPDIGDGLLAGRFSVDHAVQIARLQSNPRTNAVLPIVIGPLLDDAEQEPYAEFRRDIDEFISQIDQDGSFADLANDIERRDAKVVDLNGSLEMRVTGGDPITTAQVIAIFESFVDGEYQNDLRARRDQYGEDAAQYPLARTNAQRRHDALAAVFAAAGASPEGRALPEPTVHLVVDEQSAHDALTHAGITLADGDHVDISADTDPDGTLTEGLAEELVRDPEAYRRRRCQTSTGARVHPMVALRALLTGQVRRVVINSRSEVIDYGTKQRLFTGAAREAALLLADVCTFPGCRLPARMCEVDHVTPWSAGGATDQANSGIECGPHNVFKHTAGLTVRRDEHGRPFHIRPDGTIMLPVGQRPPDLSIHEATELARARLAQLRLAS